MGEIAHTETACYKKLHKTDMTLNQNVWNMLKIKVAETLKRLTVQVNSYTVSLLLYRGKLVWCRVKVKKLPKREKTLMKNVKKTFQRLKREVRKKVPLSHNASSRSIDLSPIASFSTVVRTR